jgi:putative endonuclease
MYYVYLLECADGTLYTGITTDPKRRLEEHRRGTASHYTSARGARSMIYTEPHPDRSSASKREAQIKRLSRARKLALAREA